VALQKSIASMQEQMISLDQKAVKQSDLLRDVKAERGTTFCTFQSANKSELRRVGRPRESAVYRRASVFPMLPAYSPGHRDDRRIFPRGVPECLRISRWNT